MKIRAKDLARLGIEDNVCRSIALDIIAKRCKHHSDEQILAVLTDVVARPEAFRDDAVWGALACRLAPEETAQAVKIYDLRPGSQTFAVFGAVHIEQAAIDQMQLVMQLPISVAGALMPDAHAGYGLPVGGVLAADNAVIPYGVGLDIGCGMRLSIFDTKSNFLSRYHSQIVRALNEHTHFGMEGGLPVVQEHEILDRREFSDIPFLRPLHRKAVRQLGSSGSGNHFVEFGEVTLDADNSLGLAAGEYVALLSHSGSRGLGAEIAKYYVQRAHEQSRLPQHASHLVWLDLATEAGEEYWQCMNLAADYAAACHELIHRNLSRALGIKPVATVANHHNLAWREEIGGRSLIVHRKGAIRAYAGELSVIPGSMSTQGCLVSGKGCEAALNSTSHGAGRAMSRAEAVQTFAPSAMRRQLQERGVTLVGGSIEECSDAYKSIDMVMASQSEQVKIEGRFMPRIVRMNDK